MYLSIEINQLINFDIYRFIYFFIFPMKLLDPWTNNRSRELADSVSTESYQFKICMRICYKNYIIKITAIIIPDIQLQSVTQRLNIKVM